MVPPTENTEPSMSDDTESRTTNKRKAEELDDASTEGSDCEVVLPAPTRYEKHLQDRVKNLWKRLTKSEADLHEVSANFVRKLRARDAEMKILRGTIRDMQTELAIARKTVAACCICQGLIDTTPTRGRSFVEPCKCKVLMHGRCYANLLHSTEFPSCPICRERL